jgi:hypothetical protein
MDRGLHSSADAAEEHGDPPSRGRNGITGNRIGHFASVGRDAVSPA